MIGARDLAEALALALPGLEDLPPIAPSDVPAARMHARRLFALALERSTALMSWRGLARYAKRHRTP